MNPISDYATGRELVNKSVGFIVIKLRLLKNHLSSPSTTYILNEHELNLKNITANRLKLLMFCIANH